MNIATVRIGKELRALIWPWCALTVGAILFLPFGFERFSHPFISSLETLWRLAGFWIGLPFLATLSIGYEFQHGTTSLLFAQPIDRIRVWIEKWIVLAPAIAAVAVLYLWSDWRLGLTREFSLRGDWQGRAIAIAWIVTATCTATFWTLVGRSILNGLVLNLVQGFVMFWFWQGSSAIFDPTQSFQPEVLAVCVIAATAYAFLMLWLGRRKFVRFEVSGGSANADLLLPGSRSTSRSTGLLRSRPGQPIFNLIRKEVRLLWIVWVLVVVAVLGVLCLAALQFVPGYSLNKVGFFVSAFVLALALLSAILAGSLSMGEERTSGTQSWHRTLPVSARTQWLIKLLVVLSVSFLSAALPLAVAKFTVGQNLAVPFDFGFRGYPWLSVVVFSSLIGFAAFWCACVVKGTVRAALFTIPAIVAVLLAVTLSLTFVQSFFFTDQLDALILRFHPFPFSHGAGFANFGRLVNWLLMPALILALIQSYRLFRRELQDRFLPALSPLLEVALVVFLLGMALGVPVAVVYRANGSLVSEALYEVRQVTAKLPSDLAPPGEANSRQLTIEELAKVSPLSETARIMLRDATIAVRRDSHDVVLPMGGRRGARGDNPISVGRSGLRIYHTEYVTTIRFRNGLSCSTDGYSIHCDSPANSRRN